MVPLILLAALASVALAVAPDARAQDEEDANDPRTRHVLACEESARLSIDRDRVITRSIAGAQEPDPIGGGGGGVVGTTGAFPGELSRFEEDRRRRRLIDDCLSRAGLGEEPAQ
ncbi:MAG TPA: hypothetical protein VF031_01225 [Alphaproteobacteria bacterium]